MGEALQQGQWGLLALKEIFSQIGIHWLRALTIESLLTNECAQSQDCYKCIAKIESKILTGKENFTSKCHIQAEE